MEHKTPPFVADLLKFGLHLMHSFSPEERRFIDAVVPTTEIQTTDWGRAFRVQTKSLLDYYRKREKPSHHRVERLIDVLRERSFAVDLSDGSIAKTKVLIQHSVTDEYVDIVLHPDFINFMVAHRNICESTHLLRNLN